MESIVAKRTRLNKSLISMPKHGLLRIKTNPKAALSGTIQESANAMLLTVF
jgi:hypothetical protein